MQPWRLGLRAGVPLNAPDALSKTSVVTYLGMSSPYPTPLVGAVDHVWLRHQPHALASLLPVLQLRCFTEGQPAIL